MRRSDRVQERTSPPAGEEVVVVGQARRLQQAQLKRPTVLVPRSRPWRPAPLARVTESEPAELGPHSTIALPRDEGGMEAVLGSVEVMGAGGQRAAPYLAAHAVQRSDGAEHVAATPEPALGPPAVTLAGIGV